MVNPSARLLRLLAVLQSRPRWTGPELADRLGVSSRTVRYDVNKLRDLGYQVRAETGVTGGYALRPGGTLPPLQLDDDEAVAIAIGLRMVAAVAGLGDHATTALLKLEQVLPWRLRGRVNELRSFTDSIVDNGPPTDPEDLVFLTAACHDRRVVRFVYTARNGVTTHREVEPYRLVLMGGRWYLLSFDPSRRDWRSFRLERMTVKRPAGARFDARRAPDTSELVSRTDAYYRRHYATVLVAAPAEVVARRVPAAVPIERVDEFRSRVHATGESAYAVAINLLLINQSIRLEDSSPEVVAALGTLSERIAAATP